MGGLLHLVQQGGPTQSFLVVPHVTAHPSAASVLITVLLYDGPLLCGFNVAFKGLMESASVSHSGDGIVTSEMVTEYFLT